MMKVMSSSEAEFFSEKNFEKIAIFDIANLILHHRAKYQPDSNNLITISFLIAFWHLIRKKCKKVIIKKLIVRIWVELRSLICELDGFYV